MKSFLVPSKIQPVAFTLLLLTSILVLFYFPIRSETSLWKGYRVLSCDLEVTESDVTNRLDSAGIHDYVSQTTSKIKSNNPYIPVHPLIEKANFDRNNWFINTNNNLRYFYIPDSAHIQKDVFKALSGITHFWNLEESIGFTYIPIIFTSLVMLLSLVIPKNRYTRLILLLPSIYLSWSLNTFLGYASSISSIFFITFFGILIPHKKIELLPKQTINRLKSHPELIICAVLLIIFSGIGGLHSVFLTFFYLLLIFSLVIIITLLHSKKIAMQSQKRLHRKFIPIAMHPQTIKALHPKNFFLISSLIFLLSITLGVPFFVGIHKIDSAKHMNLSRELCIPTPSGYTHNTSFNVSGFKELREKKLVTNLPDLGDFISLQWQIETAPWVKIGQTVSDPDEGLCIEIFQYNVHEDGMLVSSTTGNVIFDNQFISKVLDSNLTPLEKMLQKQGRFVSANIMRLQ